MKMNFERNPASLSLGGYELYSEFESLMDKITNFNERRVSGDIKLMSLRLNHKFDEYRVSRNI